MRFVIAQRRLAAPGGSETFVITLAEHISRLGHEVVVHALELGLVATIAEQRAISVVRNQEQLPAESDATVALDRLMAIDLARRYPSARRYAMHNADQIWLPPPEPGIVAATLAPSDRFARLACGCAGAGEVVRITKACGFASVQPPRLGSRSPQTDSAAEQFICKHQASALISSKRHGLGPVWSGTARLSRTDNHNRRGNGEGRHGGDGLQSSSLRPRSCRV
jgi:hypothetical protein